MKQKTDKPLRRVPNFKTDEDAEAFLEQDLSDLDFSQFRPMRFSFELKPKEKSVNLRLSEDMLVAVRDRAKHEGIPYQRFIRHAIERALNEPKTKKAKAS
jgi:predicted DNA binding CopG/RHH family protein